VKSSLPMSEGSLCGCRDLAGLNSSVLDDVVLSPHRAGSTPRCRIDMEGQIRASQVFKASKVKYLSPLPPQLVSNTQCNDQSNDRLPELPPPWLNTDIARFESIHP